MGLPKSECSNVVAACHEPPRFTVNEATPSLRPNLLNSTSEAKRVLKQVVFQDCIHLHGGQSKGSSGINLIT